MLTFEGGTETVEELMVYLKDMYKGRPALQDELKKVNLNK